MGEDPWMIDSLSGVPDYFFATPEDWESVFPSGE
jgi:hypothetical protein